MKNLGGGLFILRSMKRILIAYLLSMVAISAGFIYCANSIGHSKTKAVIEKKQVWPKKADKTKRNLPLRP